MTFSFQRRRVLSEIFRRKTELRRLLLFSMPGMVCRLAQKFGGFVNLELHTDTAHDIKAILYYGKRIHDICPDKFIVKVPFTAEGVIGAKLLRDSGVKTNITLGFSARQNVFLTRVSRPDYLNVFVGRIGDYLINNNLGDGTGAGERAVISTQNWVTGLSAENPWQTKLLVASMRNINQIESLGRSRCFYNSSQVSIYRTEEN